jgi:cellulose synthase/poly-beta-1,6-N-acetylglucosamine synthase-like glycosyltransferase
MKSEVTDIEAGLTNSLKSIRVFTPLHWLVFSLLSLVRAGVLLWFFWSWFRPAGWWSNEKFAFFVATSLLLIGLVGNLIRWIALPCMKRPVATNLRPGWRVAAVTTCVPALEPRELIESTLRALVALDYPHDTWLLDEGDSAEMRDLCRPLGVHHFSRSALSHYQENTGQFAARSKHGNYNAWLHESGFGHYDIMISFDPDHVPSPEYASSVLGFFEDERVAYVQAPQVYRNQNASLVARGAAEETYAYNSVAEMASFAAGAPVLTGSHNAQRLSALQEYGGLPDHAAEDLLQTAYYRLRGWRGVYVPKVLATGLAPEGWSGYLNQQIRWARSVFDIKFRRLPAGRVRLSVKSGIEFLQGFGYLQDAVLAAGSVTLFVFLLAFGVGRLTFEHIASLSFSLLLVATLATDLYRQHFYLQPETEAGFHWRPAVLRLAKWPFVWKALWLAIRNKPFQYVVTPKTRTSQSSRRLTIPHGMLAALVLAAWVIGARRGLSQGWLLELCAAAMISISLGLIVLESLSGHGQN